MVKLLTVRVLAVAIDGLVVVAGAADKAVTAGVNFEVVVAGPGVGLFTKMVVVGTGVGAALVVGFVHTGLETHRCQKQKTWKISIYHVMGQLYSST